MDLGKKQQPQYPPIKFSKNMFAKVLKFNLHGWPLAQNLLLSTDQSLKYSRLWTWREC